MRQINIPCTVISTKNLSRTYQSEIISVTYEHTIRLKNVTARQCIIAFPVTEVSKRHNGEHIAIAKLKRVPFNKHNLYKPVQYNYAFWLELNKKLYSK